MTQPIEINQPLVHRNDSPGAVDLMSRIPQAAMEAARNTHKNFLKSLETAISKYLAAPVTASLVDERQNPWSDCRVAASHGHTDVLLDVPAFDSICVLRFSWNLLQQLLDILLAAPTVPGEFERKTMTTVEQHLLAPFFKIVAAEFESACGTAVRLGSILRMDISEEVIERYRQDVTIRFLDQVKIGEQETSFEVMMSGFLARLMSQSREMPIEGPEHLAGSAVAAATVDFHTTLETLTLRLGDLMDMKPGQILLTDKSQDSLFTGLLNGRPLFKGELVAVNDRCGFQLTAIGAAPPASLLER